jgi:antirestriction protein ArdC
MPIYYKEPKLSEGYKQLVSEIINDLKTNNIPWRKPWFNKIPSNLISKKPYHGINVISLLMHASKNGFVSPYWLSERQVFNKGGKVKYTELEKPATLIHAKWELRRRISKNGKPYIKGWLMMRTSEVYNLEQTKGITDRFNVSQSSLWDSNVIAEKIVYNYKNKPKITNHSSKAFYSPSEDYVGIPDITQFNLKEEYYCTLFHELIHSTGHPNRLKRILFKKAAQTKEEYAKEELVAEFGAAFLSSSCNFHYSYSTYKNSVSYISSWLNVLQNDETFVFTASAQAQKAVYYILNKKPDSDESVYYENEEFGNLIFDKKIIWN